MNTKEARIVAHICGDGWLNTYLERNALHIVHGRRYRQNRKRYEMGYCNTKKELLEEFEKDMLAQFNIKPRKVRNELRFRSKRVFERISMLGGGKSRDWFIDKEILNSSKKIKKGWLGAFFDDECTFDPVFKRLRVKSMNFKGLKQVKRILSDLNIQSNITGPNTDKSFYLSITGANIQKFYNNINLKHKLKRNKMRIFLEKKNLQKD